MDFGTAASFASAFFFQLNLFSSSISSSRLANVFFFFAGALRFAVRSFPEGGIGVAAPRPPVVVPIGRRGVADPVPRGPIGLRSCLLEG